MAIVLVIAVALLVYDIEYFDTSRRSTVIVAEIKSDGFYLKFVSSHSAAGTEPWP